jgi:hypothetical protein
MITYETKFVYVLEWLMLQSEVEQRGKEGWQLVHINDDGNVWSIIFQRKQNNEMQTHS